MADTMQLLTAASRSVVLRDQHSWSSRVTRRETVMKPAPSLAFAHLAKGFTLALALAASIAAFACSAAGDETSWASRQNTAVVAQSSAVVAGRQRILAHPTHPDPATRYVEKLYKQLMRSTPP